MWTLVQFYGFFAFLFTETVLFKLGDLKGYKVIIKDIGIEWK